MNVLHRISMQKIIALLIFFTLFYSRGVSQDTAKIYLSREDSLQLMKDLFSLLGSNDNKPSSYFEISANLSNKVFSERNKGLNDRQENIVLVYTPMAGYFHKSGLALQAGVNWLNDKYKGFDANQGFIMPSYELQRSKSFSFNASWTYFFVKDKFSPYSSPVQSDFYLSAGYKKTFLMPVAGLGYSSGEYKEVLHKDTTVGIIRRKLYDSITYRTQVLSVVTAVEKDLQWSGVLAKPDQLQLSASAMLNWSYSQAGISHKTNANNIYKFLVKRGRIPRLSTTAFRPESLASDIGLDYQYRIFFLRAELYLDYYLPADDTNRLSSFFNISFGVSF